MGKKIRFGVLSTAKIGLRKVIPAMQVGDLTEVTAIASRTLESAEKAAKELGIAKAYGSYEELLADPEIDAIYNPLPNDLHVPWTIRAAFAGKHVLCEKPIALNAEQARTLLTVKKQTRAVIAEAFMVKLHPQWVRVKELIDEGRIGPLRLITGTFSYFNDDPANIRNKPEQGGGALMDIGCYLVFVARQLFGAAGKPTEPTRVVALADHDPVSHVDRLTSFVMDFSTTDAPGRQAIFSCSTQMVSSQRVQAFGTTGRIEVEIPFNTPPDRPARIAIDSTGDFLGSGISYESFPAVDQYTLQGDAFARAILEHGEPPVPLEEAIANMAVIDALFCSVQTNQWERPIQTSAP